MLGSWLSLGPAYTLFSRRSRSCLAACSGSWLSLGPAYTLCTSRRSARPCLAACSVLSLQSIVVHTIKVNYFYYDSCEPKLLLTRVTGSPRVHPSHTSRGLSQTMAVTNTISITHGLNDEFLQLTSRGAPELLLLLEDAAWGLPHTRSRQITNNTSDPGCHQSVIRESVR